MIMHYGMEWNGMEWNGIMRDVMEYGIMRDVMEYGIK